MKKHLLIIMVPIALQADPTFEAQTIDDKVAIGYGIAIGDVDGDGKPDILLADKKKFVWYRNPEWTEHLILENLTFKDNVCIAAEDIDGDGKVEIAVGAQWNPGNTTDRKQSGSVHYLLRPEDLSKPWKAMALPHDPTTHRMRWVKMGDTWNLVVLPLHGEGNKGGAGKGVNVTAYTIPAKGKGQVGVRILDDTLHLTHNFDHLGDRVLVGCKEGVKEVYPKPGMLELPGMNNGAGEVRMMSTPSHLGVAVIEPMHGTALVVYLRKKNESGYTRHVLDEDLKQGHSIATGDFLGLGRDQVVAGWRNPNKQGKIGIKLYIPADEAGHAWTAHWIDDNGMACEDLKAADLNGDGKLDLIAAGRVTKNLKIYWNRNP
jgi:hypothetical protein